MPNNRRALFLAPLYDATAASYVPGARYVGERLTRVLQQQGGYDARAEIGIVDRPALRSRIRILASGGDHLFLYLYGHGHVTPEKRALFVTSDAKPDDEGISIAEIVSSLFSSDAREAIVALDCCYSGTSIPFALRELPHLMEKGYGRALFASCLEHQLGWTEQSPTGDNYSLFARHFIEGLEGAAANATSGAVRANSLADHLVERCHTWKQQPIALYKEGGGLSCTMTTVSPTKRRSTASRLSVLVNVPFRPSQNFVGRQAELDTLVSSLVDANKYVAVSTSIEGMGGIGKTELALQLINLKPIQSHFSQIFWLDASAPVEPQIQRFVAKGGADRDDLSSEDIKNLLAAKLGGDSLIILDNVEDWSDFRELIPSGCALLATTRTRDFGGNAFKHVELDVLTPDSSREFLLKMEPRLSNDPGFARLLAELDGHALALELAGSTIRALDVTADEYLVRTKSKEQLPPDVIQQVKYGKTVEECLDITWNTLSKPSSRELWKRASLFAPTSAHRSLLRISFLGENEDRDGFPRPPVKKNRSTDLDFDEAFSELRRRNVFSRIEGSHGERWSMHRHVREYARLRVSTADYTEHARAIAEWLRQPDLDLAEEIPHIASTILDGEKFGAGTLMKLEDRYYARELAFRSSRGLRDSYVPASRYFMRYIKTYLSDPRVLKVIFDGLLDVNEDVRAEAVRILEESEPTAEIVEGVAKALDDLSPTVRTAARRTLITNAGERVINTLVEIARSSSGLSATEAARSLREIGHRVKVEGANDERRNQIIAALRRTLDSKFDMVREESAIALGELGYSAASPLLASIIRNPLTIHVRRDASYYALFTCDRPAYVAEAVETLTEGRLKEFVGAVVQAGNALDSDAGNDGDVLSGLVTAILAKIYLFSGCLTFSENDERRFVAVIVKLCNVTATQITAELTSFLCANASYLPFDSIVNNISDKNSGASYEYVAMGLNNSLYARLAAQKLTLFWAERKDEISPNIVGALGSKESQVRSAAARFAELCPDPRFFDPLVRAFENEGERDAREAIDVAIRAFPNGPQTLDAIAEAKAKAIREMRAKRGGTTKLSTLQPRAGCSRVTFIQSDNSIREVYGEHGSTLMELAVKEGISGIEAECGGACACATCHVYVEEGWLSMLPPMAPMEKDMLDFGYAVEEASRLSCQIKVTDEIDGIVLRLPERQA